MKCACGYNPGYGGNRMAMHDAHWCPTCDVWLSSKCDGWECDFCLGRPEKPSEVEDQCTWEEQFT